MTGTQLHLPEILGRSIIEGDLIVYRGVLIDHALGDERVFIFIDELSRSARRALFSVYYNLGGIELMWRHNPPGRDAANLAEGMDLVVAGDRWRIEKSRLLPDD